jgi:DNA primase
MNHTHHSPTEYSHEWRLSGVPPLLTFLPTPILTLFPLLSEHSNPKLDSYLKSRGISQATYTRFGVRFNEWDELVFPYTSILGNTIGIVFRNVDTKKISGLKVPALVEDGIELPKKARMGAWFGLLLIDITQPLIIVEAEICAMFAYQCGFTNVISPGGMGPTKAQIKAIPNKIIFLGYDADEAGRSGMEQTTNRLLKRDPNRTIYYIDWNRQGKGKDPSDLKIKENFWNCVNATQGATHVS